MSICSSAHHPVLLITSAWQSVQLLDVFSSPPLKFQPLTLLCMKSPVDMHPPTLITSTVILLSKSLNSFILHILPWISHTQFPQSVLLVSFNNYSAHDKTNCFFGSLCWFAQYQDMFFKLKCYIGDKTLNLIFFSGEHVRVWLARPSAFWCIWVHLNISQRSKMSQMKQSNHISIARGGVSLVVDDEETLSELDRLLWMLLDTE